MNAPFYKVAKYSIHDPNTQSPYPFAFVFNVRNSMNLTNEIKFSLKTTYVASFDIFTTYINIPTNELPDIILNIFNLTNIYDSIKKELILIRSTIVPQNCLHCNGMLYIQKEGLPMGAPNSFLYSEISLKGLQHSRIINILKI
jgi:hypothetical protein